MSREVVPAAISRGVSRRLAIRWHVFIAGTDFDGRFLVQAYDAVSGTLHWDDQVGGTGQISAPADLVISRGEENKEDRLFAAAVVGCDPDTFLYCELAIRAYDVERGLLWQRADTAAGGDWVAGVVEAGSGRVFVGASELREDGGYHGTVRAYDFDDGAFMEAIPFGESSGGFFNAEVRGLVVNGGRLLVAGTEFRPDGGGDFLVRSYRAR
jgi:hypothetical protein